MQGLSLGPGDAVEGLVSTGRQGTVRLAPDGSSTCQEPCDQELEARCRGS